MLSSIGSSISGLNAASRRIEVSANNIANQSSSNYIPKRVEQISVEGGAVQSVVSDVNPASVPVFNPSSPEADQNGMTQLPNVDVATELVNQAIAAYDYKANLKSIQIQKKLDNFLLNIFS